ncbi:tetratricopeptide repeat protein [Gemmatimonadota bacterium]
MASKVSLFLAELKRRKVYRVAAVYVVVGVGLLGVAEVTLDPLGLEAVRPYLVILVLLGFPLALVLAWAYEVRPEEPSEMPRPKGPRERSGPGESEDDRKSIAVLPFANRSGLAEDLHFTDGIHDQIISQLYKVGSLSVRGRTSVEVYRGSPKNLRTIGQELSAQYLMEGGVQRAGDGVRIIVQLIDAERDEHLWAEEYDRSLSTENLFDVQSEIALRVVSELKAVLTPEEMGRIQTQPTESLEAYEAFLRGRRHLTRHSPEGVDAAIREFEEAVALDPGYAQAYSGLSVARLRRVGFFDVQRPVEAEKELDRATAAANKALELDPALSEAHVILALRALQWDWEWDSARSRCLTAMELNPSDALAKAFYAVYLVYRERHFDEAEEMTQRAVELDPLDPGVLTYRIWISWAVGNHARALQEARELLEVAPESPFAHYWIGIGWLWTGQPGAAIRELETAMVEGGRTTYFLSVLGAAYARTGNVRKARECLNELEESAERGAAIGRWIATIYAGLGEGDEAMDWLRRGVDEHDPGVFHAMTDPFFQDYWEDPRFLEVMNRIGLELEEHPFRTGGRV